MPFSGGLSEVQGGPGLEAQIRYNPSLFGIGIGVEASKHDLEVSGRSVDLAGVFIEPRYVIQTGSETVAPYLSGRFAISQTTFQISESVGFPSTIPSAEVIRR